MRTGRLQENVYVHKMMEVQELSEICDSLFTTEEFMEVSTLKPFFMRDKMEKLSQTEDH